MCPPAQQIKGATKLGKVRLLQTSTVPLVTPPEKDNMGLAHAQKVNLLPNTAMMCAPPHDRAPQALQTPKH